MIKVPVYMAFWLRKLHQIGVSGITWTTVKKTNAAHYRHPTEWRNISRAFILGVRHDQISFGSAQKRKYQQTETVTHKIREINTSISSDNENAMCFLFPSFPTWTKKSICFPQSIKDNKTISLIIESFISHCLQFFSISWIIPTR